MAPVTRSTRGSGATPVVTRSRSRGGAVTPSVRGRGRGSSARGSGVRGRGVEQTRGRGRSRGKSVQQREPSPDPIPPPIPPTNYEDTTDPKGVTTPVLELIHPTLRDAWRVNGTNKMETIFDSVNPVRQFRRGEIYDETAEDAFAEYEPSPELDPNLTESDEDCNLKPYNPITFVPKWSWREVAPKSLWMWSENQTESLEIGWSKKPPNKATKRIYWRIRYIPIPYIRLYHQLHRECQHGATDRGHEAQRRWSYAVRVLNAFGDELWPCATLCLDGPASRAWRSKVLTPILQRHLHGVSDVYAPALRAGVSPDDDNEDDSDEDERSLTIADMTRFYLGDDPIHPSNSLLYLRNLIYVREVRWFMATLLNPNLVGDIDFFNLTLGNQDYILEVPDEVGLGLDKVSDRERAVLTQEGTWNWIQGMLHIPEIEDGEAEPQVIPPPPSPATSSMRQVPESRLASQHPPEIGDGDEPAVEDEVPPAVEDAPADNHGDPPTAGDQSQGSQMATNEEGMTVDELD